MDNSTVLSVCFYGITIPSLTHPPLSNTLIKQAYPITSLTDAPNLEAHPPISRLRRMRLYLGQLYNFIFHIIEGKIEYRTTQNKTH